MAISDVYRITVGYTSPTAIMQTQFHFRMKTAPDPTVTQLQVAANAMKELYRPQQTVNIAYNVFKAEQLFGGTVVYQQPSCRKTGGILLTGALTGTLTGGLLTEDPLPYQDSLVTTLRTGFSGRSKRGRSYMTGNVELNQSGGVWATPLLTAMNTAWTTFLGLFGPTGTNADFLLGVWSQITATGCKTDPKTGAHIIFASPSPQTAFTTVTDVLLRSAVRTQRRRAFGIGQ